MAQASIAVTAGSGPPVDFRTVGATPYYRQVIALGDPDTDTGTAPVDATYGVGADIKRVVADPFGANADTKVTGDTAGSYSAKLRGANYTAEQIRIYTANSNSSLSDIDLYIANLVANVGGPSGAKVITDANGTLQQYLRGLVYLWTQGLTTRLSTDTIYNGTTALTPKFVAIAASSSGNNTILAAVSSKKIRVLAAQLISNGTVNAKWQTGAGGTDLTGLAYLVANAGYVLPFNPSGWFETAATTLLNLNLSAGVAVGGSLVYVEV